MAARKNPARSPIEKDANRALIERALAMGVPATRIAKRFGYTISTICNYRDRMPPQLKAAIAAAVLKPKEADLDRLRSDEAEGILGNLANQRARLLIAQDEALETGAIREVGYLANVSHRHIELVGKYRGEFAQHHVATAVNILVSEDSLRLRQALTLALRPYPEARRAVAEALHAQESAVAATIMANASPPRAALASPQI